MDNTPFPRQSDLGSQGASPMPGSMGGMGGTATGSSGLGGTGMGSTGTSEQARQAVERASATAHQTVDRLASSASRFAERLDENARRLTDAPMRMWQSSRSSVQDHPMQAIAASLVIGFLLGRLTGSRGRYDDY